MHGTPNLDTVGANSIWTRDLTTTLGLTRLSTERQNMIHSFLMTRGMGKNGFHSETLDAAKRF